jgi:hypothetical protein
MRHLLALEERMPIRLRWSALTKLWPFSILPKRPGDAK